MSNVTRRSFVKGAAGLGAAAAAMPVVAMADAPAEEQAEFVPWDAKTEEFNDSQVVETIDCEIVVVGGSVCGVPCALTAVEEGAATVLLEMNKAGGRGPHWIGAVGSKQQIEAGCTWDRATIVNDLM